MTDNEERDPLLPVRRADKTVQKLVREVLKIEREKLYQRKAHVVDDITRVVKDLIK